MSLHEGHKAGKSIGVTYGEYKSNKELHLVMTKGIVEVNILDGGRKLATVSVGFRFFFSIVSDLFYAFYGERYGKA